MLFSQNPMSLQNLAPARQRTAGRTWSAGIARTAGAVLAACGALLWLASPASAETVRLDLVQTIDTSTYAPSSPDPSGIAYLPAQDQLLIGDSEVNEMPMFQGINLYTATRTGSGVGSGDTTAYSGEPADLGIDTANGRLFIADDDKDRVFIVSAGSDGTYGTADDTRSNFRTSTFGSTDPEGVVYDPATGHVFVSDGLGIEIYDVDPVNGVFGDGNDLVTHFDVAQYGAGDCEGLGLDLNLGRLLCVDPSTPDNIYELGKDGTLFRVFSMAAIPTRKAVVADVTMAPSSNPNDDPATMSYWIVDRHLDNNKVPDENDGLLYEMAMPPPQVLVENPISSGTNDAQQASWGTVSRTNSDIELGIGSFNLPVTAGLRFTGVQIPKGATIVDANVQFRADETGSGTTNLTIRAERADNSAPITTSAFNISNRPRTSASVAWAPPAWPTVGASGPAQLTPNLASVIQEVVNRPGWVAGNALTVIVTGSSGNRTADSFEGGAPPVLRVKYVVP
jgi:hypothetical protein